MARTATRTANVFTRVDPETKEQAESILNQLGILMSNAIGMFLKQIVMQRGIPFEMKLPASVPAVIDSMTKKPLFRLPRKVASSRNRKSTGTISTRLHKTEQGI